MYGFNKVNDMIHSNMRNENQTWEFRHPHFQRGQVQDLQNIKRKSVKPGNRLARMTQDPGESSSDVQQPCAGEGVPATSMLRELTHLEGRLQYITSAFTQLQSEMVSLRVTLSRQQRVSIQKRFIPMRQACAPPGTRLLTTLLGARSLRILYS